MENQNQYNPNQPHQGGFYQMPPVPNATTILVLGILSIVFCWTYGVVGLILGILLWHYPGSRQKPIWITRANILSPHTII